MKTKLILNADDYGRTPEISRGIRDAHLRGIVTSTTCMMNVPTAANDIRLALDLAPGLGLGVHLVLTADSPLLAPEKVKSLCDARRHFLKLDVLLARLDSLNADEVKAEWRAQIERFISTAKKKPTHLDSHHHSSYFSVPLFRIMLELAKEYDCAIRLPVVNKTENKITGLPDEVTGAMNENISALLNEFKPRTPDGFFADFYDEQATNEEIIGIIESLSDGVFEIMCHPGYNDALLTSLSSYSKQRENELAVLTDPAVKKIIQERNIQLVNFAKL
jgi:hypothetical protein